MNYKIVLIAGKSATGKSMSLRNLRNPEGVWYLNCENNKALPFKPKFKCITITDPMQVLTGFDKAETKPEVHTIIVDTLTFLMGMYESQYVLTSNNTQKAWGDYSQFFLNDLMQDKVAKSTKRIIFLAHTVDVMNELEQVMETFVKVKGAIMNNGVEASFTTVIGTKKVNLRNLVGYENPNLKITEDEEIDGFKYVYQTRLTKGSVGERIRAPLGMWDRKETFIDNDLQIVLDRLDSYYADTSAAQ